MINNIDIYQVRLYVCTLPPWGIVYTFHYNLTCFTFQYKPNIYQIIMC